MLCLPVQLKLFWLSQLSYRITSVYSNNHFKAHTYKKQLKCKYLYKSSKVALLLNNNLPCKKKNLFKTLNTDNE